MVDGEVGISMLVRNLNLEIEMEAFLDASLI